jgi:crotonobetainyl-CoA:carnitine CoA-transferase CaiB-like acyl-CoA transferase
MSEPIFAGLKVIDCASFIAGPAAATILADHGAEVIKIEPPGAGDAYRSLFTRPGAPNPGVDYAWLAVSRNKRGLALDLKAPEGRAILERLVSQADIFVTNFPLPVRERLRTRYADFAAKYPRLIYASLTAYGEAGPEGDKTGFDTTAYWARSGLMDEVRADHSALPARSVPGMGDHPTASALFGGIAAALYRRERTGQGGEVRANLMNAGMWANTFLIQAALCGATIPPRPKREDAPNALGNMYQAGDGRWFIIAVISEDRQWAPLATAMGLTHLIADPPLRHHPGPPRQRPRPDGHPGRRLRHRPPGRMAHPAGRRRHHLRPHRHHLRNRRRPPGPRHRRPAPHRRHALPHRGLPLHHRRGCENPRAPRAGSGRAQQCDPAGCRILGKRDRSVQGGKRV